MIEAATPIKPKKGAEVGQSSEMVISNTVDSIWVVNSGNSEVEKRRNRGNVSYLWREGENILKSDRARVDHLKESAVKVSKPTGRSFRKSPCVLSVLVSILNFGIPSRYYSFKMIEMQIRYHAII